MGLPTASDVACVTTYKSLPPNLATSLSLAEAPYRSLRSAGVSESNDSEMVVRRTDVSTFGSLAELNETSYATAPSPG